MQRTIYPPEIIGQTSEMIFLRDTAKGHIIYCLILSAVIFFFILLPILEITVSVQSEGIIRPLTEKVEISILSDGLIVDVFVTENQYVNKGDTILRLDASIIDEKSRVVSYKIEDKNNEIQDLKYLVELWQNKNQIISKLKTFSFKNEYFRFFSSISDIKQQQKKAEKEKNRYQALFKENLASLSDLEDKELAYTQLLTKYDMFIQQQLELWNKHLLTSQQELKEYLFQQEQISQEREFYTIKAPIAGTIEQFSGIVAGSYLRRGTVIATLSPDTDLIAEIYVSPQDIGFLKEGIPTRLQVYAFDHHQWGLVSGSIQEISNDFFLLNNMPVFKIKSSLDQAYLQLKNGRKGYLKKGMTFRARFLIARVTLFRLLYKNINDWLNPLQA